MELVVVPITWATISQTKMSRGWINWELNYYCKMHAQVAQQHAYLFFLQEYIYERLSTTHSDNYIMETAACMGNNIIYVVHKNELRIS